MSVLTSPPPAHDTSPRPRLVPGTPVIDLGAHGLQIGCDSDRGLRVRQVPEPLRKVAGALRGRRTIAELAAAYDCDPDLVDNLVRTLEERGLLACESPTSGPLGGTPHVQLITPHALAVDLSVALLDAGVGSVQVVTSRSTGIVAGIGRRRPSLARRTSTAAVQVVDHHRRVPLPWGTPTVVVSSQLEPDRALVADLMRSDAPHLVVRPRPLGVVVGPFVVPGRTACLSCTDHTRLALDPLWDRELLALSTTPAVVPPEVEPWVAATVVQQLSRWARDGRAELVGQTYELSTQSWRLDRRRWEAEPTCGCRWTPHDTSTWQ